LATCYMDADQIYKKHLTDGHIIKGAFVMNADDKGGGIIALILASILLCGGLFGLVQMLLMFLLKKAMKVTAKAAQLNDCISILVGLVVMIIVQSSLATTSALTQLCGMGSIPLEKMLPLTLGANIGTPRHRAHRGFLDHEFWWVPDRPVPPPLQHAPNGLAAISKVPESGWGQILAYRAFCETSQDQSSGTAASKGDFGFKVLIFSDPAAETAKLGAEIANGRLAMRATISMVFRNGLIGFAWGDWVLYIAFLLRAFEHVLGEQVSLGFWDPAGFVADGSIENFASSSSRRNRFSLGLHSHAALLPWPAHSQRRREARHHFFF
jgi:hypothetical protein